MQRGQQQHRIIISNTYHYIGRIIVHRTVYKIQPDSSLVGDNVGLVVTSVDRVVVVVVTATDTGYSQRDRNAGSSHVAIERKSASVRGAKCDFGHFRSSE